LPFITASVILRDLEGRDTALLSRVDPEQIALDTAKSGSVDEEVIIRNLGDEARLEACYGAGEWVKMQYVLRGSTRNVTVHWFRNLTTGANVEFKFT
jgi:hypothetical protein